MFIETTVYSDVYYYSRVVIVTLKSLEKALVKIYFFGVSGSVSQTWNTLAFVLLSVYSSQPRSTKVTLTFKVKDHA